MENSFIFNELIHFFKAWWIVFRILFLCWLKVFFCSRRFKWSFRFLLVFTVFKLPTNSEFLISTSRVFFYFVLASKTFNALKTFQYWQWKLQRNFLCSFNYTTSQQTSKILFFSMSENTKKLIKLFTSITFKEKEEFEKFL